MTSQFVTMLRRYLKYADSRPIAADSPLRDLGLDSMRAIELLFDIEDTFGIMIPDELLSDHTFETAGGLWSVIEELRGLPAGERLG